MTSAHLAFGALAAAVVLLLFVKAVLPRIVAVVEWFRIHRSARVALWIAAVGLGILMTSRIDSWWVTPALLVFMGAVGWLYVRVWRRRPKVVARRWKSRTDRVGGLATMPEMFWIASAFMMRFRLLTVVRPSLVGISLWRRLRTHTDEFAIPMCRVGWQTVWASIEDVCALFGGPRTGKTAHMGGWVISACGSLIVTSTRIDLWKYTRWLRELRGPVKVFNPGHVGKVPSTIRFDPLTGCADPVVAFERAVDMLGGGKPDADAATEDRQFWLDMACENLAVFLHAAAIGNYTMPDVKRWIADTERHKAEITSILYRSPQNTLIATLEHFLSLADRTRTSITVSMSPAVAWMASPVAYECARPRGDQFDVAAFLDGRETLYLLGVPENHTTALVGGLVGYITRTARRLAEDRGGRLDPPLTLALDEAGLTGPGPLSDWTADMGGRGICIQLAFQSWSQMVGRYGAVGSGVILNNIGSLSVFGGVKNKADRELWSDLAGSRDVDRRSKDADGKVTGSTPHPVPVVPAARITNMPRSYVVCIRRNMLPVIGRGDCFWQRRDYRDAKLYAAGRTPIRHRALNLVRQQPAPPVTNVGPIPDLDPELVPAGAGDE